MQDGWNPANQLRLVVSPIIDRVWDTSQVVQDFWTINSIKAITFLPTVGG